MFLKINLTIDTNMVGSMLTRPSKVNHNKLILMIGEPIFYANANLIPFIKYRCFLKLYVMNN